jgi:hypothetical protein
MNSGSRARPERRVDTSRRPGIGGGRRVKRRRQCGSRGRPGGHNGGPARPRSGQHIVLPKFFENKWRRGWDCQALPWAWPCGLAVLAHHRSRRWCRTQRGFSPHPQHQASHRKGATEGPFSVAGGEGGIRTHVGLAPPTDFESAPVWPLRYLSGTRRILAFTRLAPARRPLGRNGYFTQILRLG